MYKTAFTLLTLLLIFLFTQQALTQIPQAVQQQLNKAPDDLARIKLLKDLVDKLPDEDSLIIVYTEAGLALADKNLNGPQKDDYLAYKAELLSHKGHFLFGVLGQGEEGKKILAEAESIARNLNSERLLAHVLENLQDIILVSGDLEQLKHLIDTCLYLQKRVDDKKGMVTSYTNLGNYHTGLGNSDSTIICYQKAYSIAEEIKDTILQAYTLGAVGFAYVHKGKSQEALPYLFKSVKLMEENGTGEDAYPALQGIGNVFAQLGEQRKAISYFDSAIVLAKAKPNYISLSNLYFYKANALIRLNQPDSAITYLEPAISVARQINYLDLELAALIKMGSTYLDMGDTIKALEYFRLSLDKNREAQLRENLQESYFYMGIIMLSKNKIDSAYYYATLAEKTLEGLQFNSAHKQVEFLLSNVYERKGDFKNALSSYKKFIVFRDSVDNQRVFRTTLEKQFQYESEKKDLIAKAEQEKNDIQFRAQKNRLVISTISFGIILALGGTLFYTNRKRKETVYKQHLAESEMKALRAQMNPHFMFNSLNAIQQMVLNNENENAFRYLDTYSKLTRKILENSEKKWITLQDEIKFLELYLQIESLRFQNAFTYEIIVEPDVSVHDDKIPAMIIQPLVENAVKHGLLRKENDGKLLIIFRKQADKDALEVIIEDNGVGREAAASLKNNDSHQSMSLEITENRLHLLDESGRSKIVVEDLHLNGNGVASGTRVKVFITQPV